jgi:hypothetical protein
MPREDWPLLEYDTWRESCETLHMWTQIVGKIRLALEPPVNHWWHVALYVSARGLTTGAMPVAGRPRRLELEFDFLDHALVGRTADGHVESLPLAGLSVRAFYSAVMAIVHRLGVDVRIWPMPVEVATAVRWTEDTRAAYDAAAVRRFWQLLLSADAALRRFRSSFAGKASPVHFFWGSFDLAVTRFSGRTAPPHPGGIPNLADWVVRDAYSHEVSSCGFWPGAPGIEAAFYSYSYPEPEGFATFPLDVEGARYDNTLREYLLPYATLRAASDPDALLTAFLHRTFEAAAVTGRWDRGLEWTPHRPGGH